MCAPAGAPGNTRPRRARNIEPPRVRRRLIGLGRIHYRGRRVITPNSDEVQDRRIRARCWRTRPNQALRSEIGLRTYAVARGLLAVGVAFTRFSTPTTATHPYRAVSGNPVLFTAAHRVRFLPDGLARLRQLGPLTDDNLLIFRDRTPKGRHYTARPRDPPTGLQDSSFGAGCFGNAKSS